MFSFKQFLEEYGRNVWFHRGLKNNFNFFNDELQKQYQQALQTATFYHNNSWLNKNDPQHRESQQLLNKYSLLQKPQFFTSSLQNAMKYGNKIISINLPPEVYRKYITMGGSGDTDAILLPAEDLNSFQKNRQYPIQINSLQDAQRKFGGKNANIHAMA